MSPSVSQSPFHTSSFSSSSSLLRRPAPSLPPLCSRRGDSGEARGRSLRRSFAASASKASKSASVLWPRSTDLPGSLSPPVLFCHDTLSRSVGPRSGPSPRHNGTSSLSSLLILAASLGPPEKELLIGASGRAASEALLLLIIGRDMHKSLSSLAALPPPIPPSTCPLLIPPSSLSDRCSSLPALITFGRRFKSSVSA